MEKFKHLNKKKMEKVIENLGKIQSSLEGVGALFQGQGVHSCPDINDFYGMGDLMKTLAKELLVLEDTLENGYDSRAITKNYGEKN